MISNPVKKAIKKALTHLLMIVQKGLGGSSKQYEHNKVLYLWFSSSKQSSRTTTKASNLSTKT